MLLKEINLDGADRIDPAQVTARDSSCKCGDENFGFQKGKQFL